MNCKMCISGNFGVVSADSTGVCLPSSLPVMSFLIHILIHIHTGRLRLQAAIARVNARRLATAP
jgi:hypothetical protein